MRKKDWIIDFIGIGTPKAGSSWIFKCLSEHPQICGSKLKEMRFFDNINDYKKGMNWYFSFFPKQEPGQLVGEFSPSYIHSIETAKRIHENFPNVKLISVFRNPIDKLYSLYWYNKIGGKGSFSVFNTFEDVIKLVPQFLEDSLHGKQFKNYLDIFPRGQIHTLLYDDIVKNPQKAIKDIYKFLNIDDAFEPPSLYKKVNETGDKHMAYPILFKVVYSIYWRMKKITWLMKIVKKFNTLRIAMALAKFGMKKGGAKYEKPPMDPQTRENLRIFYKNDIKLLENLINRDLSEWK
jgi:hypothetical protein